MNLQFVTDQSGKQRAVVIPIKEWEAHEKKFDRLQKKLQILAGLSTAAKEIRDIESGKKKAKTLDDLLNEL